MRETRAVRREVVAGVEHVRNGSNGVLHAPRTRLSDAPIVELGSGRSGVEFDVSEVNQAAPLPDGRTIAFSPRGSRVLVFSLTGEGEHVIGRAGQGPGEFLRVPGMVLIPPDSILLVDFGNRRINRVSVATGAVSGRGIRSDLPSTIAQIAGVLPGDRIVLHGAGRVPPSRSPEDVRSQASIHVLPGKSGDRVQLVTTVPDLQLAWRAARRGIRGPGLVDYERFGPRAHVIVWDTVIVTATGRDHTFTVWTAAGKQLRRVSTDLPQRAVTPEMRDAQMALEKSAITTGAREPLRDSARAFAEIRNATYADSLAAIGGLYVSTDNVLWVLDAIAPGDTSWSATSYHPSGEIRSRLRVRGTSRPVGFGADRVVLRTEDADGLGTLSVYRLIEENGPVERRRLD